MMTTSNPNEALTLTAAGADCAPDEPPPVTPLRRAWQTLRRRPAALFGGAVLCLVIAMALLAPWVAPHDPLATRDRKSVV
jgi:ABC-type antimicrobial peptide transport system permease subunit